MRLRTRPMIALAVALAVLFAALAGPLHDAGTFAAHMVQHLALGWVAAPLLVMAEPWPLLAALLPRRWLVRPTRWLAPLGRPLVATSLHGAVVWLWHLPVPYEWALRDEAAHALEHAGFLLGGVAFWWMVWHALRRGGGAAAVACGCLLVTTIHEGMLGAILTLGSRPLYPSHPDLADQQLAGLIMWVPVGVLYICVGTLLAGRVVAGRHQGRLRRSSGT